MIVHSDQKKFSSSSSSETDSDDETMSEKVYRLVSTDHDSVENVIRITPIFVESSPTDFEKTDDIFEGEPDSG